MTPNFTAEDQAVAKSMGVSIPKCGMCELHHVRELRQRRELAEAMENLDVMLISRDTWRAKARKYRQYMRLALFGLGLLFVIAVTKAAWA